jgi:fructokinase
MNEPRIYPLISVTDDELAALVDGPIDHVERVDGGITNTIHRITLATGTAVAVKHYAGGADAYAAELAMLRRLAGILPVPEIVRADDDRRVIVYKWIDGITLNECRKKHSKQAHASLAEPLGRLLAWIAQIEAPDAGWDPTAVLARTRMQLVDSRAARRLGAPLCDALRAAFETHAQALAWGAPCLSHDDLSGRNILVQQADGERWRIGGVLDWEAAGAGSPLVDLGSLVRHADRYDAAFRAAFERGYREADGTLPDDWWRTARLLDATWLIETLDEDRELPGVFADCRMLLAKLVADLRA